MIVADASWIIALRDPHDAHHGRAVEINDSTADERVLLHPLTLAECLVGPATLGVADEAAEALMRSFEVPVVDDAAALRWAKLRAESRLRLPDAVVLDTAVHHAARAVVTYDLSLAAAATARGLTVVGA